MIPNIATAAEMNHLTMVCLPLTDEEEKAKRKFIKELVKDFEIKQK